jgi:hypothetical protein
MALSPKEFFFRKKRMENKTLCLMTFSSYEEEEEDVPLDIQFSFPEPGRWRINALAEILKSQCLSPTTIFK